VDLVDPEVLLPKDNIFALAGQMLQQAASEAAAAGGGGDSAADSTKQQHKQVQQVIAQALGSALDPTDAELIHAKYASALSHRQSAAEVLPDVEWMIRSTYMHLDLFDSVYKHADPHALHVRSLQEKKRKLRAQSAQMRSRRERVEDGFRAVSLDAAVAGPGAAGGEEADVSALLQHPVKKGAVQPKRIWTLLPDTAHWHANAIQVAFDSDPYAGFGPRANAGQMGTQAAAAVEAGQYAVRKARLERALLRTPPEQPVNLQEGTVMVSYYLPFASDAVAEEAQAVGAAAPPTGESPASGSGTRLLGVRDYHMVLERAEAGGADEALALLWDDAAATIRFLPLRARGLLTALELKKKALAATLRQGGGGPEAPDAVVLRRAPSEDEADQRAAAAADVLLPAAEAQAVHQRMEARRAERAEALRRRHEEQKQQQEQQQQAAPLKTYGSGSGAAAADGQDGSLLGKRKREEDEYAGFDSEGSNE
jgi:hypothetical protein